jgi:hypothetical protein
LHSNGQQKKWSARYDLLEQHKVRDIKSYHENIVYPPHAKKKTEESQLPEKMPYIVIIIDELADIMQAYPRELGICNRTIGTNVTSNRNSLSSFNTATIGKRHHWTHQGKHSITISTSGCITN